MDRECVILAAVNAKYIHSNLAVYSLKANAGEYENCVGIAEYTINHRHEEILRGIYSRSPRVVGFSCYIWNIRCVLDVAADLRSILPDVVIVLGGPEVSYDACRVLEQNSFVDMIMVGEGETTFREFLTRYAAVGTADGDQYADIAGLCVRSGGSVRLTALRAAVNMDELVFPYRTLETMDNRIIYYETMRGCPFSCSYCLSSVEKGVRMRSLDKVFEELRFFLDRRVKQVKFVDRTFNCSHDHAYRIWEYIHEHDNGVTNFHFEIGGDLLREEDFTLFRKFRPGLVQFEVGVQSTNPRTLREIRRKTEFSALVHNLEKVRQTQRIHQHVDLIAGLPYEGMASFRKSFNEVYELAPDQLQLGFLKLLKGSFMDEKKEEYTVRHGKQPPYEVLSTRWLAYEDLAVLKQVEEMVDIYYNGFQFQATMALLETCHTDAFAMYESLGKYYDDNGYFEKKHSRAARYEIVWDYVKENFPQQTREFRETLTYDLYLRDYVKNPPSFVKKRSREYLALVREFLEREAKYHHLLEGYDGIAARQLFHMVYVDEFELDMRLLVEEKKIRHVRPYSLAFDYRHRNPLNHSARVIVPDFCECPADG